MHKWLHATAALALLCGAGSAEAWPDQPVRIVVPFAAGGTTDVVTRIVAERLSPRLGQPVVIENVGGAGGNNGAALVAKSPPNGYALLMATPGPAAMNQFMYPRMPYDTASAFAPVVLVATNANVFVVGPKSEAKSIGDFVAQMKAKPEAFNFGSAGNGSTGHLGGTLFAAMVGAKAQHVPYRGSAPMLQDLVAGNIQFTIDSLPGVMGHIKSGTLRALAITDRKRSGELPDIPTMVEAGLPDVIITSWLVLLAPAGTPRPVIDRINAEVNAALKEPELQRRIRDLGAEPAGGSPEDLAAFLASETARWKRLVEMAGAKVE